MFNVRVASLILSFTATACAQPPSDPTQIVLPGAAAADVVGSDTAVLDSWSPSDGASNISASDSAKAGDTALTADTEDGETEADGTQPDAAAEPDATGAPTFKPIRFAMIGDYGVDNSYELAVAKLVKSHKPDFIVTAGDNNYETGKASTIDKNIGKYYGAYIKPYKGKYGAGSPDINRFWPTPGNHDWLSDAKLKPYTDYFSLPHVERYYSLSRGAVFFVCLDSDTSEPDGVSSTSKQAKWAKAQLDKSDLPYKFAVFHHPPYNSGVHGPSKYMRWPWQQWGVQVTLAGHDHSYERIRAAGAWHLVNGMGGRGLYDSDTSLSIGSQVRVYGRHGATIVDVDDQLARLRTYDTKNNVLDEFSVAPHGKGTDSKKAQKVFGFGSTWAYRDNGAYSPDWAAAVAAGKWKNGNGPFGYGNPNLQTTVGYGPNKNAKHPTTWFRRTFYVENPEKWRYLRLQLRRDDGVLVRLNGTEVWRVNLPSGNVQSDTHAAYTVSYEQETDVLETLTLASHLQKGTNVIAVEVHQVSKASSDIVFDLAMWAYAPGD